MHQKILPGANRKITVCVDSYESGVLKGRFYNAYREMEYFDGLMQLLIAAESILEEQQKPQSYTVLRRFSEPCPSDRGVIASSWIRRGDVATFEIHVLFRQHTSWQGVIRWQERRTEESFRSVLELLLLMDSALRYQKSAAM